MAFLAACCILLLAADVASSSPVYKYVQSSPYRYAPYGYAYPSPAAPHVHTHSPHVHKGGPAKGITTAVTGHVYCDTCKDGTLKEPLPGVTVGVICWHGNAEYSFYGTTNEWGTFKVKLGGYNFHKHGGTKSCRVKLVSPSYATSCMVPTNMHGGKLGAHLEVKSKTSHELIFKVGPFAYTLPIKHKKCYHNARKSTSFYKPNSKSSYKHSHLQSTYESPSCLAYMCKSTIPPSYENGSLQLITKKHKQYMSPHNAHKALPPDSDSFAPPPPNYLRYKSKI